jgi:SAM-dependent methyltransferase
MSKSSHNSLDGVRDLYEKSLSEHGATPKGVGWRDEPTHDLRFERLSRVIETEEPISVNDLGCGYGAFLEYLTAHGFKVAHFRGLDISDRMLEEARRRHPSSEWLLGSTLGADADYSFASGIFNVRLQESEARWRQFIERTLDELNSHSRRGFAFNLLSTYVDYREPHLYYGDPCEFFDLCKQRYSRKVALLHDYPLYEWTMLVRK